MVFFQGKDQPSRDPMTRGIQGVLLLSALLLAALALRLPDLSYYPFQDEAALELMGLTMVRSGSIHPPVANWPPLLYYLQILAGTGLHLLGLGPSPGQALVGVADRGFLQGNGWLAMGRVLSGLFGVFTILFVYLAGRRVLGRERGLWAALLFAAAPLAVETSRLATTDSLCAFLTTLSLWLAAEGAFRERGTKWLLASGFAAGAAAGAKYFGGIAVLAPLSVVLFGGEEASRKARAGGAAWVALACLAGTFLTIPGLLVDPGRYTAWLFGKHARDAASGWEFFRGLPRGWLFHPQVTFRWAMGGLAAALFGMGGLLVLWIRDRGARLVLLPFGAAWFLLVGYSGVLYGRYWLPFLPLLCLGAAWGCMELAGRRKSVGRILLVLLAGWSLYQGLLQDRALKKRDTRVLAHQWLKSHLPLGAGIATLYPLRTDPSATKALLREIRLRPGDQAKLAFLDRLIRKDPLLLSHLLWDSAYPALDPTFHDLRWVSFQGEKKLQADLAALRKKGVRYYIWTSFRDGMVLERGRKAFPWRTAFLASLERACGEPLARFDPGPPDPRIPLAELETHILQAFRPIRPGPEIRIYEIPR